LISLIFIKLTLIPPDGIRDYQRRSGTSTETDRRIRTLPRGVPKSGFRKTRNASLDKMLNVGQAAEPVITETDEEIEVKLAERFEVLGLMTETALSGDINALIVSGPAGLGKSYTVERALEAWDPNEVNHRIVKGYIKAPALYKLLYQYRAKGQVLVFDDADEVFLDETAVNLLKAALDSTERRIISYMTEGTLIDDETAERLPKSFRFEGTVLFLTNFNIDQAIERGSKIAPHLEALVSRSHYVDLAMNSRRDYIIRIRQVVRGGLLKNIGLNTQQQADVSEFIEVNQDRLREVSLRMALKIGAIRKGNRGDWQKLARITCCKNK
jgi:hypothetical protein